MNPIITGWHKDLIEALLELQYIALQIDRHTSNIDPRNINLTHLYAVSKLLPEQERPNNIRLTYSPHQSLTPAEMLIKNYIQTVNYVLTSYIPTPNINTLKEINLRLLSHIKPSWEAKPLDTETQTPSPMLDKYILKIQPKFKRLEIPLGLQEIDFAIPFIQMFKLLKTPLFMFLNSYVVLIYSMLLFQRYTKLSPNTTKTFWNIYPAILDYTSSHPLPEASDYMLLYLLKIITGLAYKNLRQLAQTYSPLLDTLMTLNKRQRKLIKILCKNPYISRKQLIKRLSTSHMTIYRDLKLLTTKGLLSVYTSDNGKRYYRPHPVLCGQTDLQPA